MDKMKMESVDITAQNIDKIGMMFPNCITETIDDNGKPKKAINFELLKQMLSSDVLEGDEAYEFTWVGKKSAIVEANKPIRKTLRPCKEESKNWDTTENLYIEGDNLEVLKLLQESYLNKVKMIYIDPPYNTGNDFIYNDDFKMTGEEYADELGVVDEDGNRMFKNTDTNGRFHSDWCSMIYSRLTLARNLITDDGVIFISIDDNEVENLKKICNEIFGEHNFIAQLIWQKKFSRANDAQYFSTMHDHILCYCKNHIQNNPNGWKIGLLPRGDDIPSGYGNPDSDNRGVWTSVVLSAKSGSDKLLYEIITPSGRVCTPPSGRYWSVSKEKFEQLVIDNRIWFGSNGDGIPRMKTFLSEVQNGLRPNTILFHSEVGHNQEGKQETKGLFNGLGLFDGPKPVRLLKYLLQITNCSPNDIILDFFSGSATTAHAVMQLNAEDGGNRKFIMVQLPEVTDEKSEANKAGYKNICEIGKERIRRAGDKITEQMKQVGSQYRKAIELTKYSDESENIQVTIEEQNSTPENKGYHVIIPISTDEKIQTENQKIANSLDTGFRVLKLDTTNMNDVYYSADEYDQTMLSMLESNVKTDRTDLDLLFSCLLEWGLPLSMPYCSEQIEGYTVHTYNDGDLIACFEENVPDSVVKAIAKRQPLRAVFRDSSFANSPSKINVTEIFKLLAPDTRVKVI